MSPTNRFIHKEKIVNQSIDQVWNTWTTQEGLEKLFGIQVTFDLKVGGPIEILFDDSAEEGKKGSEGCVVLAYEPKNLLSFTWNAPPHLTQVRGHHTFVEIRFEERGEAQTFIELNHFGWGKSDEWTAAYNYFEVAWGKVLELMS